MQAVQKEPWQPDLAHLQKCHAESLAIDALVVTCYFETNPKHMHVTFTAGSHSFLIRPFLIARIAHSSSLHRHFSLAMRYMKSLQ